MLKLWLRTVPKLYILKKDLMWHSFFNTINHAKNLYLFPV